MASARKLESAKSKTGKPKPRTMALVEKQPARAAKKKPLRSEAEEAVRTLIRWAGDDPMREGLAGTPGRVARAFEEFFAGYDEDPVALLQRTFEETDGYDEMVVLRDIRFESHCEHHMVPIIGRAHIAYLPRRRVIGISKLARVLPPQTVHRSLRREKTARRHMIHALVKGPRRLLIILQQMGVRHIVYRVRPTRSLLARLFQ